MANRLVTLDRCRWYGQDNAWRSKWRAGWSTRFADGVWLVELAALSDPGLVPQAVAQALEVKEQPMRPVIETLSDYLASKKAAARARQRSSICSSLACGLVDQIVRRSPDITVLITSRERLGMTGELTYRVPSLTVPGTNETLTPETVSRYEGVRLFVERAKLARSDLDLTAENASSVASICARLDGMPLAIELAAARLRSMSVDELGEGLDRRFTLLTDGSRAALPRHRTLRSTIDWSYDLLTEREQVMLRRVTVFAGGWTLASAEQVCAGNGIDASDVLKLLTSLIDKSLIVTDELAGETRYRMLETVRQYALDRLRESGEEVRWRGSHLACFVALAEAFFDGVRRAGTAVMVLSDRSRARQPAGRARMVDRIEPGRWIATRERIDGVLAHSRPPCRRARVAWAGCSMPFRPTAQRAYGRAGCALPPDWGQRRVTMPLRSGCWRRAWRFSARSAEFRTASAARSTACHTSRCVRGTIQRPRR